MFRIKTYSNGQIIILKEFDYESDALKYYRYMQDKHPKSIFIIEEVF